MEVILASASPRRAALLAQIGVVHRVLPADIDETRLPGEPPHACVMRLAEAKARRVAASIGGAANAAGPGAAATVPGTDTAVILGADTAVVLDDDMLGKPRNRAEALAMLARLSARAHRVLSAVAVLMRGKVTTALSDSEVHFRTLGAAECAAYWDSGEPRDKAGAYAIQGLGAVFVADLRGSYSGVMGLPLFETAQLLSAAGVTIASFARPRMP